MLRVCVSVSHAKESKEEDDPNTGVKKVVTIELTRLDVNDCVLELGYRIGNDSDHDVWVCTV